MMQVVLTMVLKHRTWQHNVWNVTLVDERPAATPGPDGTVDLIGIVYGQQ